MVILVGTGITQPAHAFILQPKQVLASLQPAAAQAATFGIPQIAPAVLLVFRALQVLYLTVNLPRQAAELISTGIRIPVHAKLTAILPPQVAAATPIGIATVALANHIHPLAIHHQVVADRINIGTVMHVYAKVQEIYLPAILLQQVADIIIIGIRIHARAERLHQPVILHQQVAELTTIGIITHAYASRVSRQKLPAIHPLLDADTITIGIRQIVPVNKAQTYPLAQLR